MTFFKKLQNYLFPLLLVLLTVYLCVRNYSPGTFLIGWDSLHPEFDFKEAFFRVLWGVWRQDQGLGTVAVHSHMADLPRTVIVWLLSFVIPLNLLRYLPIFLTLVFGPLGVYFLLNFAFKKKGFLTNLASFLGSLYYLFNLGTMQHFFVPFEMFNVAYALLPWIYLMTSKYINSGRKYNLVWFGVLTVLSAPMAYAATLFYAYFMGFAIFLFLYNVLSHKKVFLKRSLTLFVLTIFLNLYWILPNIYSIKDSGKLVSQAKINTLFSPEAFLRNQDFGDWKDVIIHKNFLFDWRSFDFQKQEFVDLTGYWDNHLESKYVLQIAYAMASISFLGLILTLYKRNKLGLSLLGVGVFSLFFLLNLNGPTGGLYRFLYDNFEIFKEGLRTPFTKFSIPFMLTMSYLFGYFFFKLIGSFRYKFLKILAGFILLLVTSFSLIYLGKPMFDGFLISPIVRTQFPMVYSEAFEWFKDHPGRVAQIPLNTPWGWDYYSWGYQGSGFVGFGINNPLLIRDYDRWSSFNETFYSEAAFALYANDSQVFNRIIQKYQVKYLFLDESIIDPGGNQGLLRIPDIKDVLSEAGYNKVYKKDFLTVYDTGIKTNNFISAPEKYTLVNADLTYSVFDPIYQKFGTYVQNESGLAYPFVNFDPRGPIEISQQTNPENQNWLVINNKKMDASVNILFENKLTETFEVGHGFDEAHNCDLKQTGRVSRENLAGKRVYKAEGGGGSCDYFVFDNIASDSAYAVHVAGVNKQGRSLKIYLFDWESQRTRLEELLPSGEFDKYYVVYPGSTGYTLNVETRSFGRVTSENEVNTLELIPFDIDAITNLQIDANKITEAVTNNLKINNVEKWGTGIYKVKTSGAGLLQLGQGYEGGWLGLVWNGQNWTKLEHARVNTWSNGFMVPKNTNEIYIVFWPQFLEWFGLLILAPTFYILALKGLKKIN